MKPHNLIRMVGIFGYPIRHTLSPLMHNAAFKALGLNFVYVPFEIEPQKLRTAVSSLQALGVAGVNITIPHKRMVMKYLDKIDPLAQKIGSVNTIVNSNGTLTGYNTDGPGFIKDIRSKGVILRNKTIMLLGAGGAGHAIAASLAWAGAKKVYLADTNEKQARALARKLPNGCWISFSHWKKMLDTSDVFVNATPVGMHQGDPSPVESDFLQKNIFVYDAVYNRQTKLETAARKAGARYSNGMGMLLHQGALAFELWTGKKAPLSVMEHALRSGLK